MAWTSRADVDRWFAPRQGEAAGVAYVRRTARGLAGVILDMTPPSADQSAALRKLREVVWTAKDGIECAKPERETG